MSFKQQFEWRLHVTSRPTLLVRSFPVLVAHSLPAGFMGFDRQCASPFIDALALRSAGLWSPTLCRVVWIVSIVRSSSCVKCVGRAFHASLKLSVRSVHHVHVLLPWTKKTATTIMHKIRTLFLSRDIEKSSLTALRCAAMREVAASRATVPISWSCWYCVIRTVFWFYA